MPVFLALQKLIPASVCPYMDLNSSSESDPPGTSGQAQNKNVATDVIKQSASGNGSSARHGSACLSSQDAGRVGKRVSSRPC